ncbi:hypothetical protein [Streptomyces sp. NPDC054834]
MRLVEPRRPLAGRRTGRETGQGPQSSRPVPPDRISELLGTQTYAVGNP